MERGRREEEREEEREERREGGKEEGKKKEDESQGGEGCTRQLAIKLTLKTKSGPS